MFERAENPGETSVDPGEVLTALGIAWGVHELYPNPTTQPAFTAAIDRLDGLEGTAVAFEIGAGAITCDGEPMNLSRGGTERLAVRLFVHEVEWLQVSGKPTAEELHLLFQLLGEEEGLRRDQGGIGEALQRERVYAISITQRGVLSEGLENPWEEVEGSAQHDGGDGGERVSKVARMIAAGASPQSVAEALMEEAEEDAASIAATYCNAYRAIYNPDQIEAAAREETVVQMLAAYRQGPKTRPPVDTFAEAFFLIPQDAQARILTEFLENREEGLHGLLLDQFAGTDLAALAPLLEGDTYEQLVSYVRHVLDSDEGSAEELLPLVTAARDVKVARQTTADRIREMIDGIGGLGGATGGLAGQLRAELADRQGSGREVLATLFEIEDRADRFERLVEYWTRRIARHVRDGDFDAAAVELNTGRDASEVTADKEQVVDAALMELVRSDARTFVEAAQRPENRERVVELLGRFGAPSAAKLMDHLVVEEDPAVRRTLIGLLAGVCSQYPQALLPYFASEEWFVVRNAVSIAARVGGENWVPAIEPLCDHPDHRVVVEALRALTPMAPELATARLITALTHDSDRVRETAALLLATTTAANRDGALQEALLDPSLDGGRDEVAALLAEHGTEGSRRILEDIAKKPFLVRPHRRDARRAARLALGRSS